MNDLDVHERCMNKMTKDIELWLLHDLCLKSKTVIFTVEMKKGHEYYDDVIEALMKIYDINSINPIGFKVPGQIFEKELSMFKCDLLTLGLMSESVPNSIPSGAYGFYKTWLETLYLYKRNNHPVQMMQDILQELIWLSIDSLDGYYAKNTDTLEYVLQVVQNFVTVYKAQLIILNDYHVLIKVIEYHQRVNLLLSLVDEDLKQEPSKPSWYLPLKNIKFVKSEQEFNTMKAEFFKTKPNSLISEIEPAKRESVVCQHSEDEISFEIAKQSLLMFERHALNNRIKPWQQVLSVSLKPFVS